MTMVKAGKNLTHLDIGKMNCYEVRYKDGVNLDYFGTWEAAEMYLEKYIAKLNDTRPRVEGPWTEEDFEILVK